MYYRFAIVAAIHLGVTGGFSTVSKVQRVQRQKVPG
jgi:hypothetical protein